MFTWKSHAGLKFHFSQNDRYEIHTVLSFISPQFMWTQAKNWLSNEERFSTEMKSHTGLSSYVCVYVCMYVRMYVCMYVRVCVCMYACMHVCVHICMYVCMLLGDVCTVCALTITCYSAVLYCVVPFCIVLHGMYVQLLYCPHPAFLVSGFPRLDSWPPNPKP